jgi:hypothetical protein
VLSIPWGGRSSASVTLLGLSAVIGAPGKMGAPGKLPGLGAAMGALGTGFPGLGAAMGVPAKISAAAVSAL